MESLSLVAEGCLSGRRQTKGGEPRLMLMSWSAQNMENFSVPPARSTTDFMYLTIPKL